MPYKDPQRQREACRAHYKSNKAAYVARARAKDAETAASVTAWLLKYLDDHPCVDCGETDPVVLEFDHRQGERKIFNIADARRRKISLRWVSSEVAKCDVRCANCHRRVTYQRAGLTHRG